eukprot:TRINITY_DN22431_c0_g1_i1.p1 TRINITY_DN22431_c0_g1~~TRINITY_DN22431_c0_g1_i1.p1  ORF type:complete len:932 (-),score=247.40 TRINITY_DN22431_c0_g1_i1:150-2945(-)
MFSRRAVAAAGGRSLWTAGGSTDTATAAATACLLYRGRRSCASKADAASPSRWRRARALDQQKTRLRAAGLPGLAARNEVSPRRKRGRGGGGGSSSAHAHGTDLQDLDRFSAPAPGAAEEASAAGDASASTANTPSPALPAVNRGVQRLLRRPTAALPRTPQFFVKFGAPMSSEDLTRDAPSVLVESRRLMEDVLERRQALQSAPDFIAPDTPFWRLPPRQRNRKAAEWKEEPAGSVSGKGDIHDEASRLQGIVDLPGPAAKRSASDSMAPGRAAAGVLREEKEVASTAAAATAAAAAAADDAGDGDVKTASASSAGAPPSSASSSSSAPERPARIDGPAGNLIALLRGKAEEYEKSGVNPDIKQSLVDALRHNPGTERAARIREMRECKETFESLAASGRASVETCNELIRALAVQKRMDEAMRTHDAMKLHGFEPDAETFVSLLLGATRLRDAPLARRLFLKMREQLISATPKVYAALIKAHVRAGDLASSFALVRKMEDERLTPDVVVYTTVIDGLVGQGKLEKAWEEFHSIRTWKLIQPDEVLFTVMIKACAQAREPERALNMLDDLRTCGLYPTDLTYGELIHAMANSDSHARKAFDFFNQMKAEDLPLSPFVFEKLLQACAQLGDPKRAHSVVQELYGYGQTLRPSMYNHLVSMFATAMRRPSIAESEKLQHLRGAWRVIAEARRRAALRTGAGSDGFDWTALLNAAMSVYIAGGYSQYAVDLLRHYDALGASPNGDTYRQLLEMFGQDLRDPGRFFALWEAVPREPERPADELYHLALEVALTTGSAKKTCDVLEEFCAAKVFPTPQLADRLAKIGRHVTQIHLLVARLISANRESRVEVAKREAALIEANIQERELVLAEVGLSVRDPTPEQEARDRHFQSLRKRGWFRRPWLPIGEYLASKQKGGEAYAKKHDRPRPNLLGA